MEKTILKQTSSIVNALGDNPLYKKTRDYLLNENSPHLIKRYMFSLIGSPLYDFYEHLKIKNAKSSLYSLYHGLYPEPQYDISHGEKIWNNIKLITRTTYAGRLSKRNDVITTNVRGDNLKELLIEAIKFLYGETNGYSSNEVNISKFERICSFIQIVNTLHPLTDGNGRTFVVALQNILLALNGFPFTMHYELGRATGLGGLIPAPNSEYANEIAYGCLVRRRFDSIRGMENKLNFLKNYSLYLGRVRTRQSFFL
ncbi:Fic family protein [Piscirickettsia litoralis]|uniref:Fido domain-containing protein n=1 Tax=Piscirickettsia litoralis TaxID=1891921 RepID=A0ABX2ZYF7_9GAMM|nr:Fic family protein [Piscirickettsia litoralis]ODN41268.1 hypothetical protein BGC07_17005 [Piscirickettsia litoralis]